MSDWDSENEATAYQALAALVETQREQVVVALLTAPGGVGIRFIATTQGLD